MTGVCVLCLGAGAPCRRCGGQGVDPDPEAAKLPQPDTTPEAR